MFVKTLDGMSLVKALKHNFYHILFYFLVPLTFNCSFLAFELATNSEALGKIQIKLDSSLHVCSKVDQL